MKTDPLAEFSRELARLGFRQDYLEMQLPRDVNRCGEVSWLRIHRVMEGYRVSVRGNKQRHRAISVEELTLDNIMRVLPEWLKRRLDEEDHSPEPKRSGE
jgi:hypothetical protein